MTASVLSMNLHESRRESFARASEYTLTAAEHQHLLLERIIDVLRRRDGRWAWSALAQLRDHVRKNPACPRCAQLLRRERLRTERVHGPVPS